MATKGQEVTRAGLADVFGVALPTVDGWVRQGCPVIERGGRGKQWKFSTADIANWLRERAVADATGSTSADETELKRRKLLAETQKAELELAKAKGEVALVDEFKRVQMARYAQVRANILNVPGRVVLSLLGESDEQEFKRKLRAELSDALETSASADLEVPDDDDTEPDDES